MAILKYAQVIYTQASNMMQRANPFPLPVKYYNQQKRMEQETCDFGRKELFRRQ